MRIGIEAQRIFRQKKHGMDIVILEILKQLQQKEDGNQYFVYTQPDADMDALKPASHLHLVSKGPSSYPVWEQSILPQMAKANSIDLLHCTSNTAPVRCKIPLVITIHDIIYLEKWMLTQGTWYQRFGSVYRRWNVPKVAKNAQMIITVSDYEREKIIEGLGLPEKRVRTVYNACGTHFTPYASAEELVAFRQKMKLPEKFVLFLGNTDPKKNLPNVMRALGLLHARKKLDFTLVMPDFGKEHLQAMLQEQGNAHLIDHIMLTGYIPNQELPNLYRLAEMFLYPSLRESFGIPILEAMACGTPLITSNTSAMPEVAGSGALFIDPTDPESIANQIERLQKNKILRENTIAYGLERAKAFSWAKTAQQVVALYEEVLNG
jgi:glycosyltransferase involved in cell wall biosynthesis